MFTDQEKDALMGSVANRIRADLGLSGSAPGDKPDEQDPRCWIIQRCTQKWTHRDGVSPYGVPVRIPVDLIYEDWPGYDTPMTHTEMEAALDLCEHLFPQHEFRGHRVPSDFPRSQADVPGSSSLVGEPGSSQEGR